MRTEKMLALYQDTTLTTLSIDGMQSPIISLTQETLSHVGKGILLTDLLGFLGDTYIYNVGTTPIVTLQHVRHHLMRLRSPGYARFNCNFRVKHPIERLEVAADEIIDHTVAIAYAKNIRDADTFGSVADSRRICSGSLPEDAIVWNGVFFFPTTRDTSAYGPATLSDETQFELFRSVRPYRSIAVVAKELTLPPGVTNAREYLENILRRKAA